MIYLMHEAESGHYKVGMARDRTSARTERLPAIARARRKAKQRPSTIELILWVDWPHDVEMRIHRYLWASWVEGEWFADSPQLQDLLNHMHGRSGGYIYWMRKFRAAEPSLPGSWNWRNRDRIIAAHRAKHLI